MQGLTPPPPAAGSGLLRCYADAHGVLLCDVKHFPAVFAASAACACLSKYSVGVVGLILIFYIFINKDARKTLFTLKPYAAAIFFAALMTPHILHLINTDFLIFEYIKHGEQPKYSYIAQLFMQFGAIILPLFCMSAVFFLVHLFGNFKIPALKLQISDAKAMWYSGCIIGGQALFLMIMGILGHRLDTEWTFPLYFAAGIFIMSFYPGEVNTKSKYYFAISCAVFTIILASGSLQMYT